MWFCFGNPLKLQVAYKTLLINRVLYPYCWEYIEFYKNHSLSSLAILPKLKVLSLSIVHPTKATRRVGWTWCMVIRGQHDFICYQPMLVGHLPRVVSSRVCSQPYEPTLANTQVTQWKVHMDSRSPSRPPHIRNGTTTRLD